MDTSLVIVASGSASRLYDIHQNTYPKLLINIGQQLFIEKLIESYSTKISLDKIFIIVKSDLDVQQITEAYINISSNPVVKLIEFIVFNEQIGTAKTLKRCIYENPEIRNTNLLVAWSDIYPTRIQINNFGEDVVIYTDDNNVHRINYNGHSITNAQHNGNIPGIFYFHDIGKVFKNTNINLDIEHENEIDITAVLKDVIEYETCICRGQQISIEDIGDMPKYEKYLDKLKIESRYFNQIEINTDTVVKRAITKYGEKVIANEISYYKDIFEASVNYDTDFSMPKLLQSTSTMLQLERIKGQTVNEFCQLEGNNNNETRKDLYSRFKQSIESFHIIKGNFTSQQIFDSVYDEYFTVLTERLNKIKHCLPEITQINGTHIGNTQNVLTKIRYSVLDLAAKTTSFSIIHGDPNSSNTMLNEDNEIVFIDPRGKFGKITGLYGDARYDNAKFLYGLTGYDEFNQTKDIRFDYNHDNCSIYTSTEFCAKSIIEKLDALTDDDNIKMIVAIIWLKLPYYTINNLNKAIVAYSIGLELCNYYSHKLYSQSNKLLIQT